MVGASSIGADESSGVKAAASETTPSRIQKIGAYLNSHGYVGAIAAAIALVFILVAIQPWKALPPPTEDAMVSAWNQSVRKLGIRPLFPPQEDFNVGDILAVVAAYDETPGNPREIGPDGSIVGKSVRIGHLSLEELGYQPSERPIFSDTVLEEDGKIKLQQSTITPNPPAGPIDISYVSFPKLDMAGETARNAAVSQFSASRTALETELLNIPIAETYGVPMINAITALSNWCKSKDNAGACDDQTIRKILAYGVTNEVINSVDGRFPYRLQILLVTQVYITRSLNFRSGLNASVGSDISQTPETVEADAEQEQAGEPEAPKPGDQPPRGGTSLHSHQTARRDFGLDEVIYPRPLAFGFKAIGFTLVPSIPVAPKPVKTN